MERETVTEERKSKIFGNNQLKLLEERIAGSKDDPTGQFQLQVVPKVKEILTVWIPKKAELENVLVMRQKAKKEENAPVVAEAQIPKQDSDAKTAEECDGELPEYKQDGTLGKMNGE